jgi:hypothetical protein
MWLLPWLCRTLVLARSTFGLDSRGRAKSKRATHYPSEKRNDNSGAKESTADLRGLKTKRDKHECDGTEKH